MESGSATTAPACGWTCPAGGRWTAPVSTKTAAAQAATTPAAIHAGPRDREPRDRDQPRRECRPPPRHDSPAATPTTEATEATEATEDTEDTEDGKATEAPRSSATSSLAVGRLPGCLARHLSTSDRSSPGSPLRSGALLTSRYMSKALDPAPNGPCPPAAYTTTAARLKTSLGGPASWPSACSGAKNPGAENPGDPKSAPATPATPESPNPVTLGPSSSSRTFEGLRSRCTSPAS